MIIHSIYAKNFMKYEELNLDKLPKSGVIGIVGDNESGKTSILEAVSFAIFGRTMKVDSQSFQKLINWKASNVEVRVNFSINDDCYRVYRSYDRAGGKIATIHKIINDTEELLCEGLALVESKIEAIFPLQFEVYRQSFYLGQKELTDLYEKRVGDSGDLLDKLTGLDKLKDAYKSVKSKVPQLQSEMISLEKEISNAEIRIETYDERLEEKEGLEQDLNRQNERLKEIVDNQKEISEKLSLQESFKGDFGHLNQDFITLQKTFISSEYKRRLSKVSGEFLATFSDLQKTRSKLDQELDILNKEIDEKESQFSLSNGIFQDLKGLEYLVKERVNQIEKNSQSQFGSVNIKSYFSPETLEDRKILIEHQAAENKENLEHEKWWKNIVFYIGLILLIFLILFFNNQFGIHQELHSFLELLNSDDSIKIGPLMLSAKTVFQIGAVLSCLGIFSLIIIKLLSGKQNIEESKVVAEKITMNLSLVQKELREEQDELRILRDFSLDNIRTFDQLWNIRSGFRYDPLRTSLANIIEKYQDNKELFTLSLVQITEYEKSRSDELLDLRNKLLNRDSLSKLEQENEILVSELNELSFISLNEDFDVKDDTYGTDLNKKGALIKTLLDRLKGDYSNDNETFLKVKEKYQERLIKIVEKYSENTSLLPDIWDDKRLIWELDSEKLIDLDLEALDKKLSCLDERKKYFEQMIISWYEKFQKSKEGFLLEDVGKEISKQRIVFMEDALVNFNKMETKKEELEKGLKEAESKLTTSAEEYKSKSLLQDLLKGTIDSLKARLSPNLARFIGYILPKITNQRYSRVKVSQDLEIDVYSPEKEGYVDFTALSGGTADQLLICLRLAFASSLIQSKFHQDYTQFLFMDEPMYSFDATRSKEFLEHMMGFNPNLSQVFMITHKRDLAKNFDCLIETSLKDGVLTKIV
ncbi:MAG: hypothetical protein COB02_15775 [Candidatus Cloacimonadota bacterium]|nr:MAG: hypothetical protein COB02_15775 [Candidatus Cloacimonadota bacterium]